MISYEREVSFILKDDASRKFEELKRRSGAKNSEILLRRALALYEAVFDNRMAGAECVMKLGEKENVLVLSEKEEQFIAKKKETV